MSRCRVSARVGAALLATALSCSAAGQDSDRPDLQALFGEYSGCALLQRRDRHRGLDIEYNAAQCRLPLSPCSTFKIPNALIGLQTGVVTGPGHLKAWDGRPHRFEERNRDHDLASAIRYSVVWYFQDLAREVGAERMARWLSALDYGNRDLSAGIDRFWLDSSLEITAYGQLEFLRQLTHDNLPFRPEYQAMVRDMLAQDWPGSGRLFGKTGSCPGEPGKDRPGHGWFIGWRAGGSRTNPVTTLLVVNIRGDGAGGLRARDIAKALLTEFDH